MPIQTTNVPQGGAEVIGRALASLYDPDDELMASVAAAPAGDGGFSMEVAAPQPVFVATVQDVVDGHLLASVRPDGWRYLILHGDRAVASANVDRNAESGSLEFTHVSAGPYVASTVEAIRRAEGLPEVAGGQFDLSLLDVPALNLRILWLRAAGSEDILIPLAPAPPMVEPYRRYSEAELVRAVREFALDQLAHPLGDEV